MNTRILNGYALVIVALLVIAGIGATLNISNYRSPSGSLPLLAAGPNVAGQPSASSSLAVAPSRNTRSGTVVWGPPTNMSLHPGANEPAAAMHPVNPLLALSAGNDSDGNGVQVNNTSDGGLSWHQWTLASTSGSADGAVTWLPATVNNGLSALAAYLIPFGQGSQLALAKSTDGGVAWAPIGSNIHESPFGDDREYLYTDDNPASPFYGRIYVTESPYSPGTTNYDGIAARWSTDEGTTWSPVNALVDPTELSRGVANNNFASLAVQPDGAIVVAWHRGMCCFDNPTIVVPNQVMWSRSTDGGVTFPISGTIVTVPISQSISFVSHSPGGFKWTPAPNIAVDPVDGTLYAVWDAYRQPNLHTTAAIYLSRGTPDGSSWTQPVIVDDSQPDRYQYFPWLQVSSDHVLHITYGAAVSSDTSLAQFYVQSTDRGQTFSQPFMLSNGEFTPASFMGDYQASSVGGYVGGSASILTTWTENGPSGKDQWARIGTLAIGSPTVTATPSPPDTATPTTTLTSTPFSTLTPMSTATGTVIPTSSPTLCPLSFSDVHPNDYFYDGVRYLYCQGVISGYADNTFRPYTNATRGQISKILVLSSGWQLECPDIARFIDVPIGSTFFCFVETAYSHGIISGYPDSTFRPGNDVTRGQLTKMVVLARGWNDPCPSVGHFTDVLPGSTFFCFVETAYAHGVISGYGNGTFGPGDSATRGQIAAIIYRSLFP